MTLESNRLLGAIGSLLIVLSSVASFFSLAQFFFPNLYPGLVGAPLGLLGLAGLILFMVAMNGLANNYRDRAIFNNALYWIITDIIVGVLAMALVMVVIFSVLSSIVSTLMPFTPTNPPTLDSVLNALQPYIGYFIPVGVIVFAVAVVAVVFLVRAFNRLAAASGVRLFRTAGLLFLAGIAVTGAVGLLAALLILEALTPVSTVLAITSVSSLVSLAAWALATVAFFRIRTPISQPSSRQPLQAAAPATGQMKYCPHCGAANSTDATFCVRCGEKLQP